MKKQDGSPERRRSVPVPLVGSGVKLSPTDTERLDKLEAIQRAKGYDWYFIRKLGEVAEIQAGSKEQARCYAAGRRVFRDLREALDAVPAPARVTTLRAHKDRRPEIRSGKGAHA